MVPKTVMQWKDLAVKYAAAHPPLVANEILAIIWSESTGNPSAFNSHDPSCGLMQVEMPIARFYGSVTDPKQLYNPELNMMIGSSFLAHLKSEYASAFPNWMTGYNQGETNLRKGYKDQDYWDAFNSHMAELDALDGAT